MNQTFNERLRQILILMLILSLFILLISHMTIFIPGLLGGLTLYILSRTLYFSSSLKENGKKGGPLFYLSWATCLLLHYRFISA